MAGLRTLFMLCGVLVLLDSFVNGAVSLAGKTSRKFKGKKVAFQAHRIRVVGGTDITGVAIAENTTIVFTEVPVNVGGGYNKDTGKFTAPVAGVYRFSTNACNGKPFPIVVGIMKGDSPLVQTTIRSTNHSTCGSVDTIAQLKEGDVVSVQSRWPKNRIFANNHRWLTFTGFLLFKVK